jgi:hypothetical protein
MIHGPNMMSQHLDSSWKLDLFCQFWSTQILVGYETGPVGKIISLYFQRIQEHPNWMSYATWASILRWSTRGFLVGPELEFELDLDTLPSSYTRPQVHPITKSQGMESPSPVRILLRVQLRIQEQSTIKLMPRSHTTSN